MLRVKNIIIGILVVLFLVFVFQNTQVTEVQLLFWKVSMSRALMIFGNVFVGVILGWFLKGLRSKRSKSPAM
jgi:putative membrane protein